MADGVVEVELTTLLDRVEQEAVGRRLDFDDRLARLDLGDHLSLADRRAVGREPLDQLGLLAVDVGGRHDDRFHQLASRMASAMAAGPRSIWSSRCFADGMMSAALVTTLGALRNEPNATRPMCSATPEPQLQPAVPSSTVTECARGRHAAFDRGPVDGVDLGGHDQLDEDLVVDGQLLDQTTGLRGGEAVGHHGERALVGGHGGHGGGRQSRRPDRVLDQQAVVGLVVDEVQRVEQLVLDQQHRVGLPEQLGEQRGRVVEQRRGDHSEVGHAEKVLLEALAVRRSVAAAAAHRCADDDGALHLVVVHGRVLRDVVDDLVDGEADEVAEHDLDDGPIAGEREPAATPVMPASLIGVVRTRSGKSVLRPRVTLNAPP